jgi:tripartite-type tricarboxylate transporter receptor subunit TctC
MQPSRRQFLRLTAGVVALPAVSRVASAQGFPSRYVRFVIPFPPGGTADPVARVLANRLSEVWGQQVVVDNRGGAAGNIAAQAVAHAEPDGHTFLLGSIFLATNPFLFSSVGYDPVADLTPVTQVGAFPNLMVVPNSSPARSVRDFIEHAKAGRGRVSFASNGVGGTPHLSAELFKRMAGVEMLHVPYRGGGPALNDLIPGRVDVLFGTLPSTIPLARTGTLRALAVTSLTRARSAPDIPTIAESGLPGFELVGWNALFMPAKTPADILAKVHRDTVAALAHPAVRPKLEEIGVEVTTSTPAELAAYLQSEMAKWGPIIKEIGIKVD